MAVLRWIILPSFGLSPPVFYNTGCYRSFYTRMYMTRLDFDFILCFPIDSLGTSLRRSSYDVLIRFCLWSESLN